ncbi:MAG: hypothetical protein HQM00_05675 [Magnetococcales bacterium]|nr:hypothetical protein [Magnetococcales bacterium]
MPRRIQQNTIFTQTKRERVLVKLDVTDLNYIKESIKKGCEIFGLTKGQFSLIDLIEACLEVTGQAQVDVSTWTSAEGSIKRSFDLLTNGNISKFRIMIDPSFKTRKPEFCEQLVKVFGQECVRSFRNHAKFVIIKNDKYNLVIRTSMNLTQNPRMENFEISDDKDLCQFMQGIIDEVFTKVPKNHDFVRTFVTEEKILDFGRQPETKNVELTDKQLADYVDRIFVGV